MAVQNLVSASMTPETKDQIMKLIGELRTKLGFLLTLGTDEAQVLFKAGKELVPFVEGCHDAQVAHPAILPGVFNADEFDRDYQLARDLGAISEALDQLNTAVAQTLTAVRSDALAEALEVYGAVKANRDRVPGLDVVAQNLGRYFQKAPRARARA